MRTLSGPALHTAALPKLLNSVTSNTLLTMPFHSDHCQLVIRQGPQHARVAVGKEKGTRFEVFITLQLKLINRPDRKPVDPPPIIQLKISPQWDPGQNYLQSTSLFDWREVL